MYIHQLQDWTDFRWEAEAVINLLSEVRNLQGRLIGKMGMYGFDLRNDALLETFAQDAVKSTEIEGEVLNSDQVRSSVAKRLGIEQGGYVPSDRNVDGMVDMLIDATTNNSIPLSQERLFDWHSALFPTGRSSMFKLTVGQWRTGLSGPMRVISGTVGKETVHFVAPDAQLVPSEMDEFINWFNQATSEDLVIKAAIAHLWFITIHPFQDGNGRMARALTDMLLSRADGSSQRYYSMSAQIMVQRKEYYAILEKTQKGDRDITAWIVWFLQCLINALKSSDTTLSKVSQKASFWQIHSSTLLNNRQVKVINKLLDGFEGKLNSSKWAKINKCSKDSAVRDINDLIKKKILKKEAAGGRSTSYTLSSLES